ncbi:hypothetical protein OIO90_004982 [Microbotryomycetes sp. JL221]|nr:hypothetical protein OIO90_004982 [Microbotryomycetes sp. JL221]
MCGISFGLRTSASYRLAGTSLPEDAIIDDTGPPLPYTPLEPSSTPSSCDWLESHGIIEPPPLSSSSSSSPTQDWPAPARFKPANDIWNALTNVVKPRGPDSSQTIIKRLQSKSGLEWEMRFFASVLHMRGHTLTKQPFTSDNGDVFVWNGEVFDGLDVPPNSNDGQTLFNKIQSVGTTNFLNCLRSIEGPYAFIYYQSSTQKIYFARDPLGRRSLLMHQPTPLNPFFLLSSCSVESDQRIEFGLNNWESVPCDAVYSYQLRDLSARHWTADGKKGLSSYHRYPKSLGRSSDTLIYPFDQIRPTIPMTSQLLPINTETNEPIITSEYQLLINTFHQELLKAVEKRVTHLPLPGSSLSTINNENQDEPARVAILFSGGIDCTLLAFLTDQILIQFENQNNKKQKIDLINVAFENPRSLNIKSKVKRNNKSKVNENQEETNSLKNQFEFQQNNEIEKDEEQLKYNVPDRQTGLESLKELKKLRPNRIWQFVEVNVPYEEMLEHRQKVIDLMYPSNTSISLAFYFASRGKGSILKFDNDSNQMITGRQSYTSKARVLLSGLGADELLGGYSRHRKAFFSDQEGSKQPSSSPTSTTTTTTTTQFFKPTTPRPIEFSLAEPTSSLKAKGNWKALLEELNLDLFRISERNLGRDDRIVSFHSKELRFPFLDSKIIDLLFSQTKIWFKMDFRFNQGLGDKLLLRLLVKQLGFEKVNGFKKRAIHFGARTAKMEFGTGKDKGHQTLV